MFTNSKKHNNVQKWHVLVAGLVLENKVMAVGPGLVIKQLDEPLSIFDLAAAGVAGFNGWATLEPLAKSCCCEIISAETEANLPGYDALNRAWLVSSILVLLGYTSHIPVACSRYSWSFVAGYSTSDNYKNTNNKKLPPFEGCLLDYHLTFQTDHENSLTLLSMPDTNWLNTSFEIINKLASESASFRLALESVVSWRYTNEPRSAIARIWSGIEALFGVNAELSFRISVCSACLLKPRGKERKDKYNQVKALYSSRSKAVHGENVTETDLNKTMIDSFHLLRDLVRNCIEHGKLFNKTEIEDTIFS